KRSLVRAGAAPGLPGLEVVGPLPTVLDAEDGAEVLHPRVQCAGATRPAPLVGVIRVPEVVVVAVCLAGQLGGVTIVAVGRAESPRPVWVEVELGLACCHELGDRPADGAGAAETVEGKAGGHIEAAW